MKWEKINILLMNQHNLIINKILKFNVIVHEFTVTDIYKTPNKFGIICKYLTQRKEWELLIYFVYKLFFKTLCTCKDEICIKPE